MYDTCPSTGKRIYSQDEAREAASRWRRTYCARMAHFKCGKCKRSNGGAGWHIGNNRLKPKNRNRGGRR